MFGLMRRIFSHCRLYRFPTAKFFATWTRTDLEGPSIGRPKKPCDVCVRVFGLRDTDHWSIARVDCVLVMLWLLLVLEKFVKYSGSFACKLV